MYIYTIKTRLIYMGIYIYIYIYIYTSAHTLARSLHEVSCANKNRFAVVVCFRLEFHASGMQIWGNFPV